MADIKDRIIEFRRVPANEIVPHPSNFRRHPQTQLKALRAALSEIGFAGAIICRKTEDGKLQTIDGHARNELMGKKLVPVLVTDLSEDEGRKLLLSYDPIAMMAENDKATLEKLLSETQFQNPDIIAALEKVAGESAWAAAAEPVAIQDPEPQIDKAAELQKKWGTQTGDIWQVGPHRLACGDCRDEKLVARLFGDKKARLIWTDPPYGVSYGEKTAWMEAHGAQKNRKVIANDSLKPEEVKALFAGALRAISSRCETGAAVYATVPSLYLREFVQGLEDGGFEYHHCLVWVKQSLVMGRSDYHYRHEPIIYGWLPNGAHYFTDDRTQDSVFEVNRPQASEFHPTTKPVELIAKMVANSSRKGELVYDPFCGSGSTILAAHQLERIGYGIELDAGYLGVQLERLTTLDPNLKPELQK